MAHPRYIRWLYEQLPELVAEGILNREQAARLRDHYGKVQEKPAFNLGFLIASLLGVLLVSSGILLIFAYNWEDLSKFWRTFFSFAPLVLAQLFFGYTFFYQRRFAAWTEGSSTFLMLMVAASIALVSQTYHIWGEPEHFLWNWMLLSVPLIYLLNSSLVTLIYLIGITSWTVQVYGSHSAWYWLLVALTIPHFIYNWRKRTQALRREALGWVLPIAFLIGWFGTVQNELAEYSVVGTMIIISGFYLLGLIVFPFRNHNFINHPLQSFAVCSAFIFLLTFSYDYIRPAVFDPSAIVFGKVYPLGAGIANFAVLVMLSIGYGYLLLRDFKERNLVEHFVTLLPFFGIVVLILNRMNAQTVAIVLANAYLLVWGIAYIVGGIRERRMNWASIGMFFILALASVRFFDTSWSSLVKGVIFLLLGIGFLLANWTVARRLRLKA